jgi:hypothetical protein
MARTGGLRVQAFAPELELEIESCRANEGVCLESIRFRSSVARRLVKIRLERLHPVAHGVRRSQSLRVAFLANSYSYVSRTVSDVLAYAGVLRKLGQ